ncbi:MAG: polysaccharide deacetylase family protein, partial [Anaerolineae bacterium]|nr:polysaccharide deacetylase family protein [Anaerolineae bacterium]
FDWEDVSGADHYRIQVDDNADFSSPAADSQPTGSTYTPSKPLANGTYYWHVRTNDGMGNWGDYSPAWTVCVDGVLPPAPTLLAPANSSTTADITPSFDWEDVPGADHYRIQVDDNADFSSPAADSEPTRSIYTPNKPLSNGTYYWRVRTNDGMGNWGDYSPVWIVYVDGVLPPAPTLLAPANSSTTSDFTPPFDWEDVENAARYRIQIDDNTDFSSTVADAQPTRSTYTPRKTLPNGTYYWRVRTGDSMGNWGEYSPAWKVTVEAELLSSIEVSAEPTATASPTVQPQPIPPSLLASPPASDISSTSTTKPVYLTFDDGPDPFYTPQLVAFLQQQGVQATFFINGADRNNSWGGIYFTCQSGPGDLVPIASLDGERVVELIDKGGFGVGLHGWYHGSIAHPEDLWHSNTFDIRTNIIQQEQALNNLGISFEPLLRAPGGPFPATPFPEYRDWYYYGWDIDAHDGYGVSPQTIIDNVLDGLSDAPDYPIILLHAGRPNTLQAIVDSRYDLLGKIKALGYTDFGLLPRPIDRTGYPPNGSIYTVAH